MLAKYLLVAAAVVGGALAQEEKCDAKPQLDLCLKNMQTNVDACNKEKLNDAVCLCKAYKIYRDNCYTLCPKDPGNATNDNFISSWCISAGGESSSVSVPASTSTDGTNTETPAPSSTGDETEPSQTGSSDDGADDGDDDTTETTTGTTTNTADASTETDNAANGLAPAGVMLAAAAVMGLVL